MYEEASGILFLFLEQPMHPGAGVSVGHVDLPIQREVHTGYPMVQSSGVKGSLREAVKNRKLLANSSEMDWIFGPENAADSRAAIVVTDARTLLFPVKSAAGVFGWVTSPHALARLAVDLRAGSPNGGSAAGSNPKKAGANQQPAGDDSQAGSTGNEPGDPPPSDGAAAGTVQSAFLAALENLSRVPLGATKSGADQALWPGNSCLAISERVILEDRVFEQAGQGSGVPNDFATATGVLSQKAIANQDYFSKEIPNRTLIVPDGAFRDFVRFSTQIETHVKIGPNGTVADTGPWDEELIPSETLMYCLIGFQGMDQKPGQDAFKAFTREVTNKLGHLQIGGDATLGRGISAIRFVSIPDLLAATVPEPDGKSNGGAS